MRNKKILPNNFIKLLDLNYYVYFVIKEDFK